MYSEVCVQDVHVYVHIAYTAWCLFLIVRQLEQRVKLILDQIGSDEGKKKEVIRGGAVDKAEQLSM